MHRIARPLHSLLAALLVFAPLAASAEPYFAADNVFPPKGFGRPHGASLVELSGGRLMATWFSSRVETSDDARIFGSDWNPADGTWTPPRVVVGEEYSKSLGNTALFRDDDGNIWMFFAAVFAGGWSGAMVDYTLSRDEGKTWSEGERLVWWPGNLPRNLPIRAGDHRMLVPLFVDFWYEADMVGSYTALIDYRDGKVRTVRYASLDDHDAIQPTLAPLADGSILLLARDKAERYVRRAWSWDGGISWSPVEETSLPNPGAAVAALTVPEIGGVLLIYNHARKKRNPLSLAVSTDGGRHFRRIADLEYRPGGGDVAFDYPVMIRTSDGLFHALWSHDDRATLRHVRFNLDWLKARMAHPDIPAPDPPAPR